MDANQIKRKKFIIKRLWPFLISLGGAMMMAIAFLIPSIQDQWDRFQARQVIEQYEAIGDEFLKEENYKMAEEAYTKAFDQSDSKRLDIEVKRLNAKINRLYQEPLRGGLPPDDIKDIDFEFLLHLQKGKHETLQHISTLNSYGIFLTSLSRFEEARYILDEALAMDSSNAETNLDLGDLMEHIGDTLAAERFYQRAIHFDPHYAMPHCYLGKLYSASGKLSEAISQLQEATRLDPSDSLAKKEYSDVLQKLERQKIPVHQ